MAFDRTTASILAVEQTAERGPRTWAWDGSRWNRLKPPSEPSASAITAMAESGTGLLLVSETADVPGGPGSVDTWLWNGRDWGLRFVWQGLPLPALASGVTGGDRKVWAFMDAPVPPTSTCIAAIAVWEWTVDRWARVSERTGNGCE
jgi:hypothetical protein